MNSEEQPNELDTTGKYPSTYSRTLPNRFIPPPNFGMIEQDLYRSGQPNELNFPFLERLQLQTIVFLAPEEPSQKLLNFIDDHPEIRFEPVVGMLSSALNNHNINSPMLSLGNNNNNNAINTSSGTGGNAWDPVSEEIVLAALEIILNTRNYPLLIMCNLGRHRTGTIVGCLRKVQRWSLTAIFEEYRRYAGSKVRALNEQFIELFDTELVRVPAQPPKWL